MACLRMWALLAVTAAASSATPQQDLWRARTRVPRKEFSGGSFAEMGEVLTGHLRRNFGRVEDCASFELPVLRAVQARLLKLADQELVNVYADATDNRRERHSSVAALEEHWQRLAGGAAPPEALRVLRDGLCHEVVMRFVHHTTQAVRDLLQGDETFVLPTLPTLRHKHDGRAETLEAHREYEKATGCLACHARLVPLPSPETPETCEAQLVAQCGKRGQLMKDACDQCAAEHAAQLGACKTEEVATWCDHPPACLDTDECPVWPKEFAAPFTLHATIPPINGAKCTFYYKYTAEVQAQTVDYYEKCFPFVGARTFFSNRPCKLFFNPDGIYLSQPGRVDCCLFKAGVGAVPPEFLQSYKLVARDELAPDMYGNQVSCDKWDGPLGFKYWTVGKSDSTYKNFGHDIVFQDGPTGVTWRWGNFTKLPEDESLFKLPKGQCSQPCSAFLENDEVHALLQDSHVRRSMAHHGMLEAVAALVI